MTRHDRYRDAPLDRLAIREVDWTHGAEHLRTRSERHPGDTDIEPAWATEAALEPRRAVAATEGTSIQVVGWSESAGRLIKVWLVPKDLERGEWWGASACAANRRDARNYRTLNE